MENKEKPRVEIFSKAVRAGKRTYFFDVKRSKSDEFYLTITESKKRFSNEDGKFQYEKHKLFLYKEDFEKFSEGLNDVIEFINTSAISVVTKSEAPSSVEFSDVSFEDLKETSENEEDK